MACTDCEAHGDQGFVAYFRWGVANIGLIGCQQHLREVMAVLRAAQEPKPYIHSAV